MTSSATETNALQTLRFTNLTVTLFDRIWNDKYKVTGSFIIQILQYRDDLIVRTKSISSGWTSSVLT